MHSAEHIISCEMAKGGAPDQRASRGNTELNATSELFAISIITERSTERVNT